MQLRPEKFGIRDDGKEVFVLVVVESGEIVSEKPSSENAIQRFFAKHGADNESIQEALRKARARYELRAKKAGEAAAEAADDDFLDDVFAEL